MKRKKLIPLLLLLLLLLLIICVWQHGESIVKNRAMSSAHTTTSLATNAIANENHLLGEDIDFKFVKDGDKLELTGDFSTDKSMQTLHTAIGESDFNNLSKINSKLSPKEGVISLTQKLLLLFSQKYKSGSISYSNKTITIEGIVENENDKNAIDALLANSSLATQNNTRVVKPEPTAEELAVIQAQKEAEEAKVKLPKRLNEQKNSNV